MKNLRRAILFFLISGLTLTQTVWSQQSPTADIYFNLLPDDGNYFLLVQVDEQQKKITIPQEWLAPYDEADNGYVSSTNYDTTVTSFNIGEGQIEIHLSSYEIQKEGLAQAAAGRDVFLVYDPESHIIHPGVVISVSPKSEFDPWDSLPQTLNF
ncbi:MAG: hypothetical protein GWN00_28630 [Aliifodinibius sp.]|nr:hypothetical protein [Fodinibius sp.]NIV14027.1 hypothetical protein [Fodinibius sp.]NIY28624.1 hypothetical protein [Fodinibius sp.]